ncbi:hybrid sensor histidine kinase/response regulator [Massilia pseudoviolaceinigra]|uniref:hybrid sensor histidine kinase/response regulator n=1 Tax=Massilia pseudoviolaceinigra TaxID=3057165 RepID=UPI002796D74E|nr:ATP-binding protein [Massilia sp. CCM 9206]MDQ1922907.1 ATP-binding protein [Massilia sp. CCM 9206]
MNYKLILLIVPDPHADIDGALAQPLKEQQLDAVLAAPAGAVECIEDLIGQDREPSVVLVGPGTGNSASIARRIRTVWPVGQILFVPAREQFEAVQTELRYVPMLGPNWSLVALGDPRLGEKLMRAVQASRQRSRLRTTLDRANVRLAEPKAVDSVAYRQSVISEHYLASLLQHSSDAIFSLGPRDNVLYWSTGAERLFQCRPRHNQPAAELPFWSAMLDALLTRIHAGASPLTAKMSTVIDAQTLHLEVSLARVQDEQHTFIGTSISARDVSDVVRAIETERAGRQNAERLGRLKDEFLALLSHELRTPLSAVIGRTQLLRIQHRDAPDLQYSLDIIERNAKLQAKLIEDLLDVSAIVTGKLTLQLHNIAVLDLLRAATESVQAMTDAKQLKLVTQYAVGAVTIAGDVYRLQQVLCNILSNSIKFTPEGGTVHVRASLVSHSLLQIVIEDTGCGIAAEFLPYVFDKFGQEDASSTRRHGGLGIGLSIAKQLAELHSGTIAVTSPGRGLGTSFTLRFPVVSAGDGTGPARQHPALPAAQSRMLAQRRILLVEDAADTRELLKDVLSAHGAHVLTAPSALLALDLLGSEALDVVVSDIGMPQMDGYQLIGEIRRRGYAGDTLPAVALTAFASTLDRQRALDAGFQAHVAKPFIVTELVATLTALLARQDQPVR